MTAGKKITPKVARTDEELRKPFLDVEVSEPEKDNPLTIYNANPMYVYRWCNRELMAAGRKGIWHTVPRNHPDFKGMSIAVDHSPDQNYFQYRDLILCCARRETVEHRRKRLEEKIQRRERLMQKEEETLIKVSKENMREGIRTLDRAIGEVDEVLAT